jgi:hypothetical protein
MNSSLESDILNRNCSSVRPLLNTTNHRVSAMRRKVASAVGRPEKSLISERTMVRSTIKGVLLGWGVWAPLLVAFMNLPIFKPTLAMILDPPSPSTSQVFVLYATFPIMLLADVLPFHWTATPTFPVICSMVLYGGIGAIACNILTLRQRREI